MAAEAPVEARKPVVEVPSRSIGHVLKPVGRWSAILLFALVFGFPLYWVITMSFKPLAEWNPPGKVYWWPENATLNNYKSVLDIQGADTGAEGEISVCDLLGRAARAPRTRTTPSPI